jgi:peptide-methionine (R)-S-oxide reductase
MLSRRTVSITAISALLAAALMRSSSHRALATDAQTSFEVTKTEEEWRKLLTPEQYYVLRKHGTERAFTSALDKQYGAGTYACAGCDLPLFSSKTKFNSGTGWPSFYEPLMNAIGTSSDRSFLMTRTEVHCRRCGGHLGHVFDDGPKPTGLRYCMNGVALKFVPEEKKSS